MKKRRTPKVNVSVSLPPHVRDSARQAAFDDNRPLSSLITVLLEDFLEAEGYLDTTRQNRPSRRGTRLSPARHSVTT